MTGFAALRFVGSFLASGGASFRLRVLWVNPLCRAASAGSNIGSSPEPSESFLRLDFRNSWRSISSSVILVVSRERESWGLGTIVGRFEVSCGRGMPPPRRASFEEDREERRTLDRFDFGAGEGDFWFRGRERVLGLAEARLLLRRLLLGAGSVFFFAFIRRISLFLFRLISIDFARGRFRAGDTGFFDFFEYFEDTADFDSERGTFRLGPVGREEADLERVTLDLGLGAFRLGDIIPPPGVTEDARDEDLDSFLCWLDRISP